MQEKEMTFLDHLEELRWHIIRSLIAIFLLMTAAFIAKDFVFGQIILGPSKADFWTYKTLCEIGKKIGADLCIQKINFSLQSRQITGQFTMHIVSSLLIGLIVAFPYVFWEIWRFIKPGLHLKEKHITAGITFFVSLLFITGALFGYYILAPLSINFLANYQLDPTILNEFDITSYVSTLCMIVLACALIFQLPMVVYFLAKIGLLTSATMRKFRKHSVVVILVVSALLTPSPDIFSQLILALPLWFLYEISIFIAKFVEKKEIKHSEVEIINTIND